MDLKVEAVSVLNVIDQLQIGIVVVNDRGEIIHMNPYCTNLLSIQTDDWKGVVFEQLLTTVMASHRVQKNFTKYDGKEITLLNGKTVKLIFRSEGSYSFWQFIDQTKEKETEVQIEQMNKSFEQKINDIVKQNREADHLMMQQSRLAAMGEMIGNIGHQWRQPLNILSLYIQDIKDSFYYSELNQQYLDQVVEKCFMQIHHMSRTINDFRNFFHPHKEAIAFAPIDQIKIAASIVSATIEESNIKLQIDSESDRLIKGFPNEFSQVLINLFINSRDAFLKCPCNNKLIKMKIFDVDDWVVISISDTAGGFPNEIIEKVFDPYFTTKTDGTGVGLYMSKMIVEHMNGSITAINGADGAVITMKFPVCTE